MMTASRKSYIYCAMRTDRHTKTYTYAVDELNKQQETLMDIRLHTHCKQYFPEKSTLAGVATKWQPYLKFISLCNMRIKSHKKKQMVNRNINVY